MNNKGSKEPVCGGTDLRERKRWGALRASTRTSEHKAALLGNLNRPINDQLMRSNFIQKDTVVTA